MGDIELWHGDCLRLMENIPSRSVRLVLTDLPYGTTGNMWDTALPLEDLWREWHRMLKKDGAVVLTSAQPYTTAIIASNFEDFRYCWYWDKVAVTGFQIAKKQPLRHIEDVAVFYREFPVYNPQGLIRVDAQRRNSVMVRSALNGRINAQEREHYKQEWTNWPKQTLRIPREKGEHNTAKPVVLFRYLVSTYSNADDLVLDCCMGSGTTPVACVYTRRRCIGIEKDADIFNTARRRVEAARPAFQRLGPGRVRSRHL